MVTSPQWSHPVMPASLAQLWLTWTASAHWRSTQSSYLVYNKIIDGLGAPDAALPRSSAMDDDITRLVRAVTVAPLPGVSTEQVAAQCALVRRSTREFGEHWRVLCDLIDAGGDALDPPRPSTRAL
jgi:hypothetical protein